MDPDRLHRNTKYRGELEQDINLQTFDLIKCQTEVLNRKKERCSHRLLKIQPLHPPGLKKENHFNLRKKTAASFTDIQSSGNPIYSDNLNMLKVKVVFMSGPPRTCTQSHLHLSINTFVCLQ